MSFFFQIALLVHNQLSGGYPGFRQCKRRQYAACGDASSQDLTTCATDRKRQRSSTRGAIVLLARGAQYFAFCFICERFDELGSHVGDDIAENSHSTSTEGSVDCIDHVTVACAVTLKFRKQDTRPLQSHCHYTLSTLASPSLNLPNHLSNHLHEIILIKPFLIIRPPLPIHRLLTI